METILPPKTKSSPLIQWPTGNVGVPPNSVSATELKVMPSLASVRKQQTQNDLSSIDHSAEEVVYDP